MTWFMVDDKWHSHPKVMGLSLSACGLWARAGSWCSDQLTDGRVPRAALAAWGGTSEHAAELVDAGLWKATEQGWVFHDWLDHQPSKKEVIKKRSAARERMRNVRANNMRTSREVQDCSPNPSPSPSPYPEERENARAVESANESGLALASMPWVRLGAHYAELYDEAQKGARNPRTYDRQRITSTDALQFQKLIGEVRREAARTGANEADVFATAARTFLSDERQRKLSYPLRFLAADFVRYLDAGDLPLAQVAQ